MKPIVRQSDDLTEAEHFQEELPVIMNPSFVEARIPPMPDALMASMATTVVEQGRSTASALFQVALLRRPVTCTASKYRRYESSPVMIKFRRV